MLARMLLQKIAPAIPVDLPRDFIPGGDWRVAGQEVEDAPVVAGRDVDDRRRVDEAGVAGLAPAGRVEGGPVEDEDPPPLPQEGLLDAGGEAGQVRILPIEFGGH